MAPPTLMTAKRWDETEVNNERYCWTSRFDPTDERVCTIMPLVLRSVVRAAEEEKHLGWRPATATGSKRARFGSRRTVRRAPALRATAVADSILRRVLLSRTRRKLARIAVGG